MPERWESGSAGEKAGEAQKYPIVIEYTYMLIRDSILVAKSSAHSGVDSILANTYVINVLGRWNKKWHERSRYVHV